MARKKVTVTKESNTGRNLRFRDNYNGNEMSRSAFVGKIKKGNYDNFHIRKINGIETPVSNPDKSKNNNLD